MFGYNILSPPKFWRICGAITYSFFMLNLVNISVAVHFMSTVQIWTVQNCTGLHMNRVENSALHIF